MSGDETLTLSDILDDLVLVMGTVAEQVALSGSASYDAISGEVGRNLSLHLLSYVRFLEQSGRMTYDRISDQLRVTPEGDAALDAPSTMQAEVAETFAEHLSEEDVIEEGPGDDTLGGDDEVADAFADVFDEVNETFSTPAEQAVEPEADAHASAFESQPESTFEAAAAASEPNMSTTTSENGGGSVSQAYERHEELGSGGIGTVYRGEQTRLKRQVAIKEVREIFNVFAGVQRGDILRRFEQIVQTQASLMHPNIVQIVDVVTDGEYPFVVMQLAPGGNLRRLIEVEERPPLAVALKYFFQILHALNAAHDQGVVHGSLKPENVVLDHSGNALLTDFGISRVVEREGGRGNQVYVGVGTVAYMAPEQFQDPNLATVRSDIYSLGIMFYEMLTGKVPGRRSPMPSSFFPDIPRALDDIFDRMSMDREEDRYERVDQIIADLYAAEDVMSILDKRSGVLFLRDPLKHGELGIEGVAAPVSAAVPAPTMGGVSMGSVSMGGGLSEAISEAIDEEVAGLSEASSSVGEEDSSVSEEFEIPEDEVDSEVEEVAAEGDDDVLGKLDKYGALFEED
ncbi:serine/threonine protein kinase [Lujinxingia sediminis]|uniref:Serine/threonine protein kinase n=1 Tax=Lujinxingia sediminis TaxID=2480984 RepID=A0ABY0CU73_9DELT|nr:serine/threonine-protein kinase [Lujinxingia sediminis]RVU44884.1 serine/threonine protein kinase [Lujinxingia sediminis]